MSRTPTVLLVLILILTFPFWIAAAGIVFGVVMGVFGGIIGLVGGIFGGIMGLIGGIFGGIFGFHNWHMGWPHFHFNGFVFFALLIIAALIVNKRQNRK